MPRTNEGLVSEPNLTEAASLVQTNASELSTDRVNIQGRTLNQLREWTRNEAANAAHCYTSQLLGHELPSAEWDSLVVTGHQPGLFHPGVWAKNFATSSLAQSSGADALNLIIDNDSFDSTRIRIPTGSRPHPSFEMVAFDEPRPTQPWEDAHIADEAIFESFGQRITERMAAWGMTPLASKMWPHVVAQRASSSRLADCLSAGRAYLERKWGLANWELPMSSLCKLDPFLWFASHILVSLGEFRSIYNNVIRQYRQVNHVRSVGQPVPELAERDGWLEAPFWIWKAGDHRRQRLFAKQTSAKVLSLSDGNEVFAELPLSPQMDACCAVEVLRELDERRIRFRTRALTTTLFARLVLADLFVHGIGGAKYDEMTDRIISRFYGLPAPPFATVSATMYLPFAEPYDVATPDELRLHQLLRELTYNPERHLQKPPAEACRELIAEKQRLIQEQASIQKRNLPHRSDRRALAPENHHRFERFREIDEKLSRCTREFQHATDEELATVRQQLHANNILKSRDFSYCLFPEEKLRPFLTDIATVDV